MSEWLFERDHPIGANLVVERVRDIMLQVIKQFRLKNCWLNEFFLHMRQIGWNFQSEIQLEWEWEQKCRRPELELWW